MRSLCLDEGILQGFYDGELAPEMLEQVASHLASCEACTRAASLVESEMELTTSAFAAEMSLSVPTERLRARLDETLAGLQPQPALASDSAASRVRAWFAQLASSFNLNPQRAIGFASLTIFFVLAAVIGAVMMRQRDAQSGLVAVSVNQDEQRDWSFNGVEIPIGIPSQEFAQSSGVSKRKQIPKVNQSSVPVPTNETVASNTPSKVLPGEKNYLQAITELTDVIEASGESSLKPTLLADYKRNLAVVDEAITATQRTARTNPKSADAAEMLFAAYQSKLDLLSAVAEQSRPLIAER
jgi:hypothetical protein